MRFSVTASPVTGSPESVVAAAVLEALAAGRSGPLVIGICGAQGSGKSTLAEALHRRFAGSAVLSLDDLYLTRTERERLARDVHPLLATRGVPGTHDTALGLAVLDALAQGRPVRLPRFDKSRDDRAPATHWTTAPTPCGLVFLEGWCLGAEPQSEAELAEPINDLEAVEDPEGRWRKHVNQQLDGPYRDLFARVDLMVFLAAPSFETVFAWRREQEQSLRLREPHGSHVMGDAELVRFVAHYERMTRHLLRTMPGRADLVLRLDRHRHCVGSVMARRGAQSESTPHGQ